MSISPQNSRRGFTLVELLVVIAIIGILVGLLLPAVQSAREAARRATCQNNIRQVVLATANYESAFQRFPAGANSTIHDNPTNPSMATIAGSLFVSILPYMDQEPLSDAMKADFNANINPLVGTADEPQPLLICPSASQQDRGVDIGPGEFSSHYVGISGPADDSIARVYTGGSEPIGCDGVFSPFSNDRFVLLVQAFSSGATTYTFGSNANGSKFRGFRNNRGVSFTDIGDGSSNTFAFAEFSGGENRVTNPPFTPQRGSWAIGALAGASGGIDGNDFFVPLGADAVTLQTKTVRFRINSKTPADYNNVSIAPLNSSHSGGINIARADSSVAFVEDTIPVGVLQSLSGVDDGVVVNDF